MDKKIRLFTFSLLLILSGAAQADILPEPTICAQAEFKIVSGEEKPYGEATKWGWASYSCAEDCAADWRKCAYACPDEKMKMNFTCLAFVVDRMGGRLRWSEDRGAPGPTVLTHCPVYGSCWGYPELVRELIEDGIKVVQIKWERGGYIKAPLTYPNFQKGLGWWTRPDEKPSSFQELSIRPGAMIKWVHNQLAPAEAN